MHGSRPGELSPPCQARCVLSLEANSCDKFTRTNGPPCQGSRWMAHCAQVQHASVCLVQVCLRAGVVALGAGGGRESPRQGGDVAATCTRRVGATRAPRPYGCEAQHGHDLGGGAPHGCAASDVGRRTGGAAPSALPSSTVWHTVISPRPGWGRRVAPACATWGESARAPLA